MIGWPIVLCAFLLGVLVGGAVDWYLDLPVVRALRALAKSDDLLAAELRRGNDLLAKSRLPSSTTEDP